MIMPLGTVDFLRITGIISGLMKNEVSRALPTELFPPPPYTHTHTQRQIDRVIEKDMRRRKLGEMMRS